jgi:hypothetical protein
MANCRIKIPARFGGIIGIFRDISNFVDIFIPRFLAGTPIDVPRNPGWETLLQRNVSTTDKRQTKKRTKLMYLEIFYSVTME